jgi:hypothetical protein
MIINPKLFENFNHLIFINLLYNKCISDKFGCDDCTDVIDHEELNRELSACYFNCFVDNECGKNLNSSVEFQCEYSEGLFEITEELNLKAQQCKITELNFQQNRVQQVKSSADRKMKSRTSRCSTLTEKFQSIKSHGKFMKSFHR